MKRIIFYSVILCLATFIPTSKGVAQELETGKPACTHPKNSQFIYCTITGYYRALKDYMRVEIDFGQKGSDYKKTLGDHTGELTNIYSMAGAMNNLSKDGWEFVQAYVTVNGSETRTYSRVHWILRKETGHMTEEEIEHFLYSYISPKK